MSMQVCDLNHPKERSWNAVLVDHLFEDHLVEKVLSLVISFYGGPNTRVRDLATRG